MSYNLQYRVSGTTTWTAINTDNTTLSVTGLSPSTRYDFEVQALDDVTGLTSAFTAIATASTLAAAPADDIPDAFTIPAISGVLTGTVTTSVPITLTGYIAPAAISVAGAGAQISVNGSAYTTSSTITPGQSFRVQLTSSVAYLTPVTAVVTASGVSSNWVVTTSAIAADTTPDGFVIPAIPSATVSTLVTSATITPTGYTATIPISVTGAGAPQISVGGAAYVTSATIDPGQSFVVHMTSAASANVTLSATVTAGGVSALLSVTTSALSIAWNTGATIAAMPTPGWERIFYGNGKFMTLSNPSDQYVGSSADGITWTSVHNGGYFNPAGQGAYGAGLYVLLNWGHNTYKTSPNGTTWTTRTLPTPDNTGWRGIIYIGGVGFVAISDSNVTGSVGQCITSPDGLTWTIRTFPTGNFCGFAYGGGRLVVTSFSGNAAAYSTNNGVTWTTTTMPASGSWYGVTYGNGKFVAVDAIGNAASSTDGVTWTARTLPATGGWKTVCYGNGRFVAAATDTAQAAISLDGLTWAVTTLPSSHHWQWLAYGGGMIILVASDINTYLYSTTQ